MGAMITYEEGQDGRPMAIYGAPPLWLTTDP
jgi:hypothetical protein